MFVFRFCFNSTPAERREKLQVNVNIKDIFAKKRATNVAWVSRIEMMNLVSYFDQVCLLTMIWWCLKTLCMVQDITTAS